MNTISIAGFKALVARDDWQREQDIEIVTETERFETDHEGNEVSIPHVLGWALKVSRLDGVAITYQEGWSRDTYDADSLDTSTEGLHQVWTVEGVVVTDDNGDEVSDGDLHDLMPEAFKDIDYTDLAVGQDTTDIDVDEDSDMETFTLQIDNEPDIRFTGELMGSAASSDNQAMGSYSYSGQTGRWTELALYKTRGGKFICHQVGRTRWQGECDRFSGTVCDTLEEVKAFFGHRWLAKDLYADAGIDGAVEVA